MSVAQAAGAPATAAGERLSGAQRRQSAPRGAMRVSGAARISGRGRSHSAHAVGAGRSAAAVRSARARRTIPRGGAGAAVIHGAVTGALALAPAHLPVPARGAPTRPQRPRRGAGADARRLPGWLGASLARLSSIAQGRLWIAMISAALVGIIGLQVAILQVNEQVGRSLEARSALQRSVSQLQVEDSALSASARVESEAARLGMVPLGEGHTTFLADRSDAPTAAAQLLARGIKAGTAASAGSAEAHGEAAQPSSAAPAGSTEQAPSAEAAGSQSAGEAPIAAESTAGSTAAVSSPGESQAAPEALTAGGSQQGAEQVSAGATTGSQAQAPAPGTSGGGTAAGG